MRTVLDEGRMKELLSGLARRRGPRQLEDFHPWGRGKGEKGIGEAVVKLDFGKADQGGIPHHILDFGLEDPEVLPVDEEKQFFQAPLKFVGRELQEIILLGRRFLPTSPESPA